MNRILFYFLALTLLNFIYAQQISLDDLYHPKNKKNFSGDIPRLQWTNSGADYLEVVEDEQQKTSKIMKVNAITGESHEFHDQNKMQNAFAQVSGISQEEAKKLASRGSYHMNPQQTAALISYAEDLFYYVFGSDTAVRLTNDPETEHEAHFSPDGKSVSFVRNNDLYVVDLQIYKERRLTFDGSGTIFNGRLDWVYQEEIYGRGNFKGYWWSPDSSKIVYIQLDESPVKNFTVVDHIPYRLDLEVYAYPKAGDPNPKVRLGVINTVGGKTQWIDLFRYQSMEFLIVSVGWQPDSKNIVFQVQNREQTWLDLNLANPNSGEYQTLFRETTSAWVDVLGDPLWLENNEFLWLSARDGFTHVYHFNAEGKLVRQITSGEWEVTSVHGYDAESGWLYFSSKQHSPIAPHIYRTRLDGSAPVRLSKKEGSHSASFSDGFKYFIGYHSDIQTPTQVRIFKADGSTVRVVSENKVEELEKLQLGKVEFLQVPTRDGFLMEAMMIKPANFDSSKKYPVMCYTYSGPNAPSVRNSWGGTRQLWHHLLTQHGYIVWVCDNRTASGKGMKYIWQVYRNFGELELKDLEDGLGWLKKQPFVDGERIGLWGWSYGGYMTSYALTHSKSFKIGISGAPVTDWRDYDTIYTERYMATPQNNLEGYRKSSPVNNAENLHGKLLLIHGTIDDNVHLQNTIQLVNALQNAGKHFSLMLYPKSRHSVRNPAQVLHLYTLMTEFILNNL